MRHQLILSGAMLLMWASSASAQLGPNGQVGPYAQSGFLPNYYNRQTQPLSPYLNLLRGGSSALNYYYGVRPGLQSGGYLGPYGQNNNGIGPRQTFFPVFDTLATNDPNDLPSGMGPTGHPVGFRNTLLYFGGGSASGLQSTGASQSNLNQRQGMLQRPTTTRK